ncbi:hypothetical protein Bca52824_090435 [Brassica carinata]|uniref:Uncharacterized protein n=1 Tax=Brassica carinata TaxID=52824 RepID=A0A8X7NZJ1_BRACI|nr:hypothetical protein Bca52824_090435 [Brassica carinata]
MDSIQFQHFKMEKPRGIFNFPAIKSFTNIFRLMELILLTILISKLSFASVKLSGDIFREAAEFLVSPRFVFFSRRHSSAHETTEAESNDLYQELLYKNEKKTSEVHETKTEQSKKLSGVKRVSFERSQSQKTFEAVHPHVGNIMRRYDSEKHLKVCDSDTKVVVRAKKPEDAMSNEQFRTKIEAFIARQKRIQKDEEHLTF